MEIIDHGKNSWTVITDDGDKVAILKNNFGDYICMAHGEIGTVTGAMVDSLLHLAKEERL